MEGTAPKPGVVFIEAEQEHLRSVMQALVAETRAGGLARIKVSRPSEIPAGSPRIRHIKTIGPMKEGSVLRALLTIIPSLQSCRAAMRDAPGADIVVDARLTIDEHGKVIKSHLHKTTPASAMVGHCVMTRLKRGSFPVSPAGRVKIEIGLLLPAPYATRPPKNAATK